MQNNKEVLQKWQDNFTQYYKIVKFDEIILKVKSAFLTESLENDKI